MYYLKFFIIGLMLFSLTSCDTTPRELTEDDELTPKEYEQLVKKVRSFIKVLPKLKNPISPSDKEFINKNEPKFIVYYHVPKGGEFRMIWRINPGYSVRVTGKGEFLKDNCKLRLTISRFAL